MSERGRLLAAVGIAGCLILTGLLSEYPSVLAGPFGTATVRLDPAADDLRHQASGEWSFDLNRYKWIRRLADDVRPPCRPGVTFLEDGEPLARVGSHDDIRKHPGLYSHWGRNILFSPGRGDSPREGATYSLRYPKALRWLSHPWVYYTPFLLACALGLLITLPRRGAAVGRAWLVRAALVAGLGVSLLPHLARYWDVSVGTPDSKTYVWNRMRSPLYPALIRAAAWGNLEMPDPSADQPPLPESLARRVVRLQRLVFWAGWLFFAACLASLTGRAAGLSVVFCFSLYYFGWLLNVGLETGLMSEALAGGLLFAAAGLALLILQTRSPWLLPPTAALLGAAVMTRVAGAMLIPLAAAAGLAVLVAHRHDLRRVARPVALSLLVGGLCLAACLAHCQWRNGFAALNPLGNHERVAFALEVGTAEDASAIADPEAREVYELALARRDEVRARLGLSGNPLEKFDLNVNCWQSANPAASEVYARLVQQGRYPPNSAKESFAHRHRVFGEIADAVMPRHRDKYYRIVRHSLATSFSEGIAVRLKKWAFPWLAGACLVCCLVGRNRLAVAALGLLASFLLADLGTCLCELPLRRYLEIAEWLALAALYCGGLSAGARLLGAVARRGAAAAPADAPAPEAPRAAA
jgi:hypothetical protein